MSNDGNGQLVKRMNETTAIVEMRGISKSFGGTRALSGVDLVLRPGSVHGLIGENGAGKSTLIKILAGAYPRDSGTVVISGEEITTASPHEMLARGISVIYQEFMLAPDLSVAENMFIEKLHGGGPFIRWRDLRASARAGLEAVGFGHLDPSRLLHELTVAEQQIVEICKALARNSRVIVFDEPTAVLTYQETQALLQLIRGLKEEGVAVLYVSHRLDELYEICDDITVLKDGAHVATLPTHEVSQPELVRLMVGRDLN
ncbi:monosaccharide ABC transporter ATP-binding protein, CUT2 family, partial [Ruaniaceae bacterium KH17]